MKKLIKRGLVEDIADDISEIDQEFTSANTSINSTKLPAVFNLVQFEPGTVNIDYGGGKFDNVADYLVQKDVVNLVYDPYNRSSEHNKEVVRLVKEHGGADSATCSNVLNVIKEPEVRLNVLNNIKKLVKPNGKVYITVYEGSGTSEGAETKAGYQLNRKTQDYLDEVMEVFPDAKRKGKLIVATNSALTEDIEDAFMVEPVTDVAMEDDNKNILSGVVSNAIRSEYDAIDIYTNLLDMAKEYGQEDFISNLEDILDEEYKHVGQLQELIKLVNPHADKIDQGTEEGVNKIEAVSEDEIIADDDFNDAFSFEESLYMTEKVATADLQTKVVNTLVHDINVDTRKYPFHLRKKERYEDEQLLPGKDDLNNVLVVAPTEAELQYAIDVAEYYELDYKMQDASSKAYGPYGVEIIIPEEEYALV